MDLPITPKFFKKLELFQELERLNIRNKGREEWDMEKALLLWAHTDHFHLGSYLSTKHIFDILNKTGKYTLDQLNEHVVKTMENLCEHGWAKKAEMKDQRTDIKFNKEGMLLAEVISETNNWWKRLFNKFFIYIAWAVIIASIIIIIYNAVHIFL